MVTQVIPQVEIQQVYAQTVAAGVPSLLALIIGPDYVVRGYSINKTVVSLGAYVGTSLAVAWPGLLAGEVVDQTPANVMVNVDQAAQIYYTDLSSAETVGGHVNEVHSSSTVWATANGVDFSGPPGSVAVGDWVRLSDPTHTVSNIQVSSVVSLIADTVAAVVGTATAVGSPTSTATPTSGGTYTGTQNTTYILTVTTAGLINGSAAITVSTNNAVDAGGPYNVTSGTPISIGTLGVTVTFGSSNTHTMVLGDQWTIAATAATLGAVHTLGLADNVVSPLQAIALKVELAEVENIVVPLNMAGSPPVNNYSTTATQITLAANMAVPGTDRFPSTVSVIASGTAYVSYRALRTANANVLTTIVTSADVAANLGNVDVPSAGLTYGVNRALSNAAGTPVMCISVGSDNLAGYQAALAALTNQTGFWRFVPLTQDQTVIDSVNAAIQERSGEAENLWATSMVGLAPNYATEEASGLATITLDSLTSAFTLVTDTSATFVTDGILPGDVFRASYVTDGWGNTSYTAYQVATVLSNTTLRLVAGPVAAVAVPSQYQIWRSMTALQTVDDWGTRTQAMSSQRVTSVFPFNPGRGGVRVPNYYLACSLAALRSSVPAQQGLTNATVLDWDDLSESSKTYNQYLTTVLNFGGYTVSQSTAGVVYIVKQLTTDISDTLHAEDSLTAQADAVSYYFDALLSPYIGKSNLVPSNLNVINATINAGIAFLQTYQFSPTLGGLMGPASVLNFARPHATLLDTLVVSISDQVGVPLNNIDMTLVITA